MNTEKNNSIRERGKATRKRRSAKICRVYELKINESKLNIKQANQLKMMFIEAKWIYNFTLNASQSGIDIFKFNYKDFPAIKHFNKSHAEVETPLVNLSAQIRQSMFKRVRENIIKLSKVKKKRKVGRLKFKSEVNSVPLNQSGVTYRLIPEHGSVKIQGIKKSSKVFGLHQITGDMETANANLIRKPSGYYLKITTFSTPDEKIETGNAVGLDFGIKTSVVDSNGTTYNWNFKEPVRLKKCSRRMNKAVKGSSNRRSWKMKFAIANEKLTNRKMDAKNKFIAKIVKENDVICIQKENISAWKNSRMKGWASKIHHSIMGGIISGLKDKPETSVIEKWFPSTQLCNRCGKSNGKQELDVRVYRCEHCGFEIGRDHNSALNIRTAGLLQKYGSVEKIPMEYRFKPVEICAYTLEADVPLQAESVKPEALSALKPLGFSRG